MKKLVRVAGRTLAAVALLLLGAFVVASVSASNKLSQKLDAHDIELTVPNPLGSEELAALRAERTAAGNTDPITSEELARIAQQRALARGKHLVEARYACGACHGASFGGGVMLDDPAIGRILGPNITSGKGGRVASYTNADWDRIVRHGLKPDGSPAVMPSEELFAMSDYELSDIIAYLRSRPPVDAEVPPPSFGPVGKVLVATGKFPLSANKVADHRRAHAADAPAEADTAEFGAHLAATCTSCHRDNLAGGPMLFGPPSWPAAANLTQHASGLGGYSFDDFERAMTQGIAKDGRALREPMTHVLPTARAMTPTERRALWTYLSAIESRPTNP
jgi:mono/diheme cytochrome c family protein